MEYRKIEDLNEYPGNPRVIDEDQFNVLCKSIQENKEYFEARPLILSDRTGELIILGGNQRYKAAKKLGLKEVPTYLLSGLTEDKEKEIVIRDNVNNGSWDWDKLSEEWEKEQLENWGLDIPSFAFPKEGEEDDFEIPKEIHTDIVPGDLFEIGPHKLLCGDCTQPEQMSLLFGDEQADLIITDPPYNVDYQGGDRTEMKARHRRTDGLKIQNDKMTDHAFYNFLLAFYSSLEVYTKPGGIWYVWHADMETVNFRSAMIEAGLTPKQCLIWKKGHMVMGRQDYHWQHEPCIYGWKEGAAHGWYSDRKQTTILEFDRPTKSKEHPTMKPVPLIAYQINNSSREGEIVCDPFIGSGTTMVAAHQLNRKCYAVELDPKYCQVVVDRMLKQDPTLEIKKNGQSYLNNENSPNA